MFAARKLGRSHKAGQAMVETILVLFFLFLAFYTVFQFADNLRARLLVDYAASESFNPSQALTPEQLHAVINAPRVTGGQNANRARNPNDPSSNVRAGAFAQP